MAARHSSPNGEPPAMSRDWTQEDEERLDIVGTFVVDFEPGLYGPFETRRLAEEWASEMVSRHHEPGYMYSWHIAPVETPEAAPRKVFSSDAEGAA
jgi:hypothetical protein